jgi:hypothetical protein
MPRQTPSVVSLFESPEDVKPAIGSKDLNAGNRSKYSTVLHPPV